MAEGNEFRLTPGQRERLRPDVDPTALERFLAALPDEARVKIIDCFLRSNVEDGTGWPGLELTGPPELERLFAAVWKSVR